jgi:amphi-Trp domain-containing protein
VAERDVEKVYNTADFVAKLRRFADALEGGKAFEIQVSGHRLYVPADAHFSVEHEQSGNGHELEFQVRWEQA